MADEPVFVRQPQPARRSAGSDDERAGFDPLAFDVEAERALGEVGILHGAVAILSAEPLGLMFHVLDQVRSVDAFGKSREIFDFGGERQLPAGVVTGDDDRFQIGARRIHGGCISCTPGTNDCYVIHL